MKKIIFTLILFLAITSVYSQAEKISIPGFGTLPVTKSGDNYQVTLDNYGTFDFKGTLNPFDLETSVTVDQLKKFPGYEVMSNLGLKDIKLKVSSAGLFVGAKADTDKNLKVLFDFFNIKAPYVIINSKISKSSFALEGILDFSREPVVAEVIPPAGTELHVEKLSMLAGAGTGGANISVISELRMKPTKWDPALKTKFELAYNLRNQEITGSGSMMDTWADPFGLDKNLKKNSISFTNTAVSFGWVIGAPSPTTLGLAVENATFFDLEFGAKMSISPANGQVALQASRNKMTMNDFARILRDGFGLDVPDVFPDNVYIRDAEILYSPNGGEIGEVEIEQGFAMKGRANLLGAVEAEIDYFANWEDGFYLDYRFNADLKDALMKEIKKTNLPQAATEKVLSTFQLRKVHTRLEAGMDLKMSGETHVEFEVFGNSHDFKMQASLDPERIINSIIDKIKAQSKIMQVAEDVVKIAGSAATASIKTVEKGWAEVSKRAGDVAEYRHHNPLLNGDHRGGDRCKSHCVPNRAKKMGNPVYEKSNAAVEDFYNKVIPKLALIEGSHKRKELIWDDWKRLVNSINKNWKKVRDDQHYWGYDKDQGDVERYGRQYRRLIDAKKAKHKKYRLQIWKKMMTESIEPIPAEFNKLTNVYFLKNMANEDYYIDISGYHFTAKRKKKTPVSVYPKDGGRSGLQGIDRFIKFIPHPSRKDYFYIQPQHSDYVFDVKGDNKTPGNEIIIYPKSDKREVQLFKKIPVPGKRNTYYIQNKESGFLVTSNGKSKALTQEKKTGAGNQQWYFESAQATDMAPVKTDYTFALRNVEANRHLDLPGRRDNAKKKDAHTQLWSMDYHPDRYISIKKSRFEGINYVQHMHSAHHYWDIEGGSKSNGAKLQLWTLNRNDNQKFRFIYAGSPMTFYIENPASGKFLDASASKINQNGCPVQIWTPDGSANQQWKLEPAGPKWFAPKRKKVKVKVAYSDKTWDLAGGPEKAKEKRSRVQIWSDEEKVDRYYVIKRSGDHDWAWMELHGGMRVDVEGGNVRDKRTKLHTWTRHNGDAQKFAIHPTGRYTCVIFTKGWKVLDVEGGKIHDNGPDIHLWDKHLGAAQQFQLIDAETGKPIDFTKYIN
ncbi:MAG TPA: RICIN domain-containing protein [Salinivirga sp.]|uniref:RICIN domain-containing protein n=1 Tax=Salinivirga sp. TaxID=1970192 RepID=UPI002B46C3B0|nr:RICIN domain-containing protein [Salinivirga sp.]HKK60557.1 RICIN domain-containing protein [Salinivirga sp.]